MEISNYYETEKGEILNISRIESITHQSFIPECHKVTLINGDHTFISKKDKDKIMFYMGPYTSSLET